MLGPLLFLIYANYILENIYSVPSVFPAADTSQTDMGATNRDLNEILVSEIGLNTRKKYLYNYSQERAAPAIRV